jgi:Fe-S cluster assembly scaffold protein SufB
MRGPERDRFGQHLLLPATTDNSAEKNWDDVPPCIKETFDKLGIPEAERKFLAGVSAQYESEVVYHSIREDVDHHLQVDQQGWWPGHVSRTAESR